jgi:hypothetical protein
MTPIQKETYEKIKSWILEGRNLRLSDKGEMKYNAFTLVVSTRDSKRVSVQIIGSKISDRKILLSWVWKLPISSTKTITTVLKNEVRKQCESEIEIGLNFMNLSPQFIPSMEKLKIITVDTYIYLDGLTKDRLYDTLNLLWRAHVFTARKLVEHFKIPKPSTSFSGI